MKISDIQLITNPDYCQLQAHVETNAFGGTSFLLWYRFPPQFERYLNPSSGDPFMALLLPAMVIGEPLDTSAPVSPTLRQGLSTIQEIYRSWHPDLHQVTIQAPLGNADGRNLEVPPAGAACFFSGGVDSLYTLLKHTPTESGQTSQSDISHLILVRGFDIPIGPEHDRLFAQTLSTAQVVADSVGKQVLPVTTNIKDFMDLFVDWGYMGHGPCLASVGLCLQSLFSQLYIASSYPYANLPPRGTHPLLDPRWSTEQMAIIHDGREATRLTKIRFIAQFPVIEKTVRVCYQLNSQAPATQLNCGRCEKCLRTMIALHIAGVLESCEGFPHTIDLDLIRNLSIAPIAHRYKDLYYALGLSGRDRDIKDALEFALLRANVELGGNGANRRPGVTYGYQQRLQAINQDIDAVIPPEETFILVDESQLTLSKGLAERAIPFPEQAGQYGGPPTDDASAIEGIERQRENGATHILFAWPAFWWLDYYIGMHTYPKANYECVITTEEIIGYSLKNRNSVRAN